MWDRYYTVSNLEDALDILDKKRSQAKVIAGGTDLILEIKKEMHPFVHELIDINRVDGLDYIREEGGFVHLGPTVTYNQCLASDMLNHFGMPLLQAARLVGSPQIRNVGTIYGNLLTASPANDTISPLIALEAELLLRSKAGKRWVPLNDFYLGVRKTILKDNEMVVDLRFKKLSPHQKASFQKHMLRNVHGISVVNVTAILDFDNEKVTKAVITLGAVAPVIIRAQEAEEYLIGKKLDNENIKKAAELAKKASKPVDDIRGSAMFRNYLVAVLVERALTAIASDKWRDYCPNPVLLWGKNGFHRPILKESLSHGADSEISTTINDKTYRFSHGQKGMLIDLVREEAGLTGTKLGCGEGECGACTLHFNGVPVMSCLIPSPRAHDAQITTIEGISQDGKLHPVQQAFIDEGAVQCGYCTPGFIMSAVKLLEEKPHPTEQQIQEALAGNLCRCTGYYSIIRAVEKAIELSAGRQA